MAENRDKQTEKYIKVVTRTQRQKHVTENRDTQTEKYIKVVTRTTKQKYVAETYRLRKVKKIQTEIL